MHRISFFLFILLFVCFWSCRPKNSTAEIPANQIDSAFYAGDFNFSTKLIKGWLNDSVIDTETRSDLEWKLELMNRIRLEFGLNRDEVKSRLLPYFPELTDGQLDKWETEGSLEMRIIDGEKRYFNRAVSNLFLLDSIARRVKFEKDGPGRDGVARFQHRYLPPFFNDGTPVSGQPFDQRTMHLHYTMSLNANAVPPGSTVRCWMPFPIEESVRQTGYKILFSSDAYVLSPPNQAQRTIYMEKAAVADNPTVFELKLEINTAAIWFDLDPAQVKPYDKNHSLYARYTSERPPHIVFSDEVVQLAKNIVGEETNPMQQVRMLYYWLNDNIPWAGAMEYSVMESIPQYVIKNKRGDCGMQTFLFLSMARSLGIPARWESGWYLLPETINLHDWAQVYFEGIGWVSVDPSFKLVDHSNPDIREFYISGIDSYRFIVNSDYGQPLYPAKVFPRSEPFDFQRGEMEWQGGNLYFDKWRYSMKVDWINETH